MAPQVYHSHQRRFDNHFSKRPAAPFTVPPNLTCLRCNGVKPAHAFSRRQLDIYTQKSGTQRVFCEACGPKQIVEIKCGGCGKTKDRDSFSKTQFKKGDDEAKCLKCVALRMAVEPYDDKKPMSAAARILGESLEEPVVKVGAGGFVKIPTHKKDMPNELDQSDSDDDVLDEDDDSDANSLLSV